MMTTTPITEAEIQKVQQMVAQKGYVYIDVQHEILDHVLCAIEEKRAIDPGISLGQAFNEVHASFGIFGFSGIEEAMQRTVQKRIMKDFWLAIKSLFQPDKFALLLLSLLVPYATFLLFDSIELAFLPYGLLLLFSIGNRLFEYRRRPGMKKFLVYRMAFGLSFISFPLGYYLFTFALQLSESAAVLNAPWVLMILVSVLSLFELVSLFAFHRALERAKEQVSKYGLPTTS